MSGEIIETDQDILNSKILSNDIKFEKEFPVICGPQIELDLLQPVKEISSEAFPDPIFNGKVRLYRDDDTGMFRNRNLILKMKVFQHGIEEDF